MTGCGRKILGRTLDMIKCGTIEFLDKHPKLCGDCMNIIREDEHHAQEMVDSVINPVAEKKPTIEEDPWWSKANSCKDCGSSPAPYTEGDHHYIRCPKCSGWTSSSLDPEIALNKWNSAHPREKKPLDKLGDFSESEKMEAYLDKSDEQDKLREKRSGLTRYTKGIKETEESPQEKNNREALERIEKSYQEYKDVVKETEGVRQNKGKPMFSPIDPNLLLEMAKGLAIGQEKYGDKAFNKPECTMMLSTAYDSLMGHLHRFMAGQDVDPDDGIHNLAKVINNAIIMWHNRKIGDDRRKP